MGRLQPVLFLLVVILGASTVIGEKYAKFEPFSGKYFPIDISPYGKNGTRPAHEVLAGGDDMDFGMQGRATGREGVKKWPKDPKTGLYVVPFTIDPAARFTQKEVDLLYWSMESLMRGSNIVFREKVSSDKGWVNFVESVDRCSSYVGYGTGPRRLQLTRSWCFQVSTIPHEIMHAIGFNHEHKRPDRDQWVVMDPSQGSDYDIDTSLKKLTPYDLTSILHYQGYQTRDPALASLLTFRKVAYSSCDWNAINTLYPGPKPAPKCTPNVLIDYCEPLKSCTSSSCAAICREECYRNFGTKCHFKGGGRFPRDAMWELGYTGEDTTNNQETSACISTKVAIEELRKMGCNFCTRPKDKMCAAAWKGMEKLLSIPNCRLPTICA